MKMCCVFLAIEDGMVEGSPWAKLHVLDKELEGARPSAVGVAADAIKSLPILKLGDNLELDVELRSYQGKSSLRANKVRLVKPGV